MTRASDVVITGLASVSSFGPCRGPITGPAPALRDITRWPTDGVRRAHLVPAFQAAQVVPGLKTRRMDRLSAWALVAAHLALDDAGLRAGEVPPERVGVTFGTAFGCLELTEAFMVSIATNGHAKADPILFPETLANLPASHVARVCGFKGPNITVSRGLMSSEAALLDAAAQLESDEASIVVVLAGDVITRGLFAWYEEVGWLAPQCRDRGGDGGQLVPGEGVGAVVLEARQHAAARGRRPYASIVSRGIESRGRAGGWDALIGRALAEAGAGAALRFVSAGPGVSVSSQVPVITPHREVGMFGGCGLVGLSFLFGAQAWGQGIGLALAAGSSGQRMALVLRTEEGDA